MTDSRSGFLRLLGGASLGGFGALKPSDASRLTALEQRMTAVEAQAHTHTVTPTPTPSPSPTPSGNTLIVGYAYDAGTDIRNPGRGIQNSYEGAPGTLTIPVADTHTTPRRYWYLDPTDAPLTATALTLVGADLQYAIATGKLLDGRFAYSRGFDQPEPPLARIYQHLEQLLPLIGQYHYVFRTLEMGFVGPWGELHSIRSAGWTDPGAHDSGPRPQTAILLNTLLDNTPPSLFIAMRYQHQVRELIAAGQISIPKQSRIALFNDGFLRSGRDSANHIIALDNGTFPDAWSGPTYDDPVGRAWVKTWGETHPSRAESDVDNDPADSAAWALIGDNALRRGFIDGRIDNLREWGAGGLQGLVLDPKGITAEVHRRLGYRLVLTEGRFSSGYFDLDIRNDGFAPPRRNYLARVTFGSASPVIAVMSKQTTDWQPGSHTVRFTCPTAPGKIALELVDPNPELDKAAYRIRFANAGTWDAGRNWLT
jgi:hypothetical protein